jgi:hypothetical protein
MRSPSGGREASWGGRRRHTATAPAASRPAPTVIASAKPSVNADAAETSSLPGSRRSDFIEDQASNTRDRQRGRDREDGGIEQRHASNIATI